MQTLIVATENKGKVKEILDLLNGLGVRVKTPNELGLHLEIVEDGQTYAENAIKKATAYARSSRAVALGDDSGLEVEALDGRPGLYSARFAPWEGATDADRRRYLLEQLASHPHSPDLPGWPARFRCTVALADPHGKVLIAEGECRGYILPEERGTNGFGYDPLFFIPEYGKTMAELGMEIKNRISHRGRALQAARPLILDMLEGD